MVASDNARFRGKVPAWRHAKCFLTMGVWTSTLATMPGWDSLSAEDQTTVKALLKPSSKNSIPGNFACLILLTHQQIMYFLLCVSKVFDGCLKTRWMFMDPNSSSEFIYTYFKLVWNSAASQGSKRKEAPKESPVQDSQTKPARPSKAADKVTNNGAEDKPKKRQKKEGETSWCCFVKKVKAFRMTLFLNFCSSWLS